MPNGLKHLISFFPSFPPLFVDAVDVRLASTVLFSPSSLFSASYSILHSPTPDSPDQSSHALGIIASFSPDAVRHGWCHDVLPENPPELPSPSQGQLTLIGLHSGKGFYD